MQKRVGVPFALLGGVALLAIGFFSYVRFIGQTGPHGSVLGANVFSMPPFWKDAAFVSIDSDTPSLLGWSTGAFRMISVMQGKSIEGIAQSSDSTNAVVAINNGSVTELWLYAERTPPKFLAATSGKIANLTFSQTGAYVSFLQSHIGQTTQEVDTVTIHDGTLRRISSDATAFAWILRDQGIVVRASDGTLRYATLLPDGAYDMSQPVAVSTSALAVRDDSQLLFVTHQQDHDALVTMNLATQEQLLVTPLLQPSVTTMRALSVSQDGLTAYVGIPGADSENQQYARIALATGQNTSTTILGSDVRFVTPTDVLYSRKTEGRSTIWRYDGTTNQNRQIILDEHATLL